MSLVLVAVLVLLAGGVATAAVVIDEIFGTATASQRAKRLGSTEVRTSARGSAGGFPTPATAGVPAGWTPTQTINGDYTVRTPGAVIEDIRIVNGTLVIAAPNVTVRRVELVASFLTNYQGPTCQSGLLIEDTTFVLPTGQLMDWDPVLQSGSFTARRIKFENIPEGLRVGGVDDGCGPVTVEDSYLHITAPADCTNNNDWHGDGIQGWTGPPLTVRNTVIEMVEKPNCGGTAPFFYPRNQGNTSADIDGLIVKGGGYPFRLGTPGTVRNLNIVNDSWTFGPIDVNCSALSVWDAHIVNLDANGQPVTIRTQPCNTNTGN